MKRRLTINKKYAFDSKEEAFLRATEVLTFLDQKKTFKIRVWENLGWHYSIVGHGFSLYEHRGSFSTMFNISGQSGTGSIGWCVKESSRSPRVAMNRQIQFVKDVTESLNIAVNKCLKRIK